MLNDIFHQFLWPSVKHWSSAIVLSFDVWWKRIWNIQSLYHRSVIDFRFSIWSGITVCFFTLTSLDFRLHSVNFCSCLAVLRPARLVTDLIQKHQRFVGWTLYEDCSLSRDAQYSQFGLNYIFFPWIDFQKWVQKTQSNMACFALGFCSCLILVKRKSYVNNRWPLQLKLQGRALTRACALDNRNPPLCVQFNHLIMLSKNFAKKCKNFSGILIIKDLYLKIRKHWNSKQSIFWWGNLWSNGVYSLTDL